MSPDRVRRYPCIEIDLEELATNARRVVRTCAARGIGVTAVTKVTAAHPDVARTLLRAGVDGLADSRVQNLQRLRAADPETHLTLLRLPMPSEAREVVRFANRSLNSEVTTLRALEKAAAAEATTHEIVLMIDVGDLREGVWPDQVRSLAETARDLPHLRVCGVGTNLACYGGVVPSSENMRRLLRARASVAEVLGAEPAVVSGGNSSSWSLMTGGGLPAEVNNLRIGEAIFLGNESMYRTPIEGTHQDVFTLLTQVVEAQRKPSVPIGEVGENAFGEKPRFEDRGEHRRAIVAVGRQDIVPAGLRPELPGVQIIGASSDHMILDVEDAREVVQVGDILRFTVRGYSALLAAFTSEYVTKYVSE